VFECERVYRRRSGELFDGVVLFLVTK
jgi:hypothetical protein